MNGIVARFRKKMKSIKDETDQLYGIITKFENATKEADQISKEVLDCVSKYMNPNILFRLTVASETMARRCTPLRWSWRPPSTS